MQVEVPQTCSSWYAAQALPASTSSLMTVFLLAPVSRVTARIDELPSHEQVKDAERVPHVASLFITP